MPLNFLRILSLVIISCLFSKLSYSNECATAIPVSSCVTYSGNTSGAETGVPGDLPSCTTLAAAGVTWYTFTGDGGNWEFETTSGFDTQLWVYSGSCGTYTCVDRDDDGGSGTLSLVNFPTLAGTTYFVLVGGYNTSEGAYELLASSTFSITDIICGSTYVGVTTGNGLMPSGIPSCNETFGTGGVEFYEFSGTGDIVTLEIASADYDTKLWVYSSSSGLNCNSFTSLICVDGDDDGAGGVLSEITFDSYFGVSYFVFVGGYQGAEGNFSMDVTCTPLPVAVPAITGPGGVTNGLQVWLKAETGTTGTSPVTFWENQGPNTAITSVKSNIGTSLSSGGNYNYNSGIRLDGGANYLDGVFSRVVPNRSTVISGNEITMFTVYSDGTAGLSMSFHSSWYQQPFVPLPANHSNNQWNAFGFRSGSTYFSGNSSVVYNTPINRSTNIIGLRGTSGGSAQNTFNGLYSDDNCPIFTTYNDAFQFDIGLWPGYANNNITSENIIFDDDLSAVDFHKVESYLAIKYGVTLGVNGASMDCNLSDNNDIWTQSDNSSYAFDIAILARDDQAELSQLKSHSVEGPSFGVFNDIVTIANGSVFSSPSAISSDLSAFSWGHNGAPTNNTGVLVLYPTDNAEVIETIFQRVWKSQETGDIDRVTIEFDMNDVVGVGNVIGENDLSNLRLLVDEDGDFSNGATSISPTSFDNTTNIAYFTHDFVPTTGNNLDQNNGFFFTLGSTDASTTILSSTLKNQEVDALGCENIIKWETTHEENVDYYSVKRSYNGQDWTLIEVVSPYAYNYIVRDIDFPSNGIIYYVVEETDLNGEKTILGDVMAVSAFCIDNDEPIIYPNPITNSMTIKSSSNDEMRLFDLNGRLVVRTNIVSGENQLDMSGVSSGTYFVEIGDSSKKVFRKKIVKL